MNRFKLWAIAFVSRWLIVSYLPDNRLEWNKEDEKTLESFLKSETGAKLQLLASFHCQQIDQHAVRLANPGACGVATGNRGMLAFILSLSAHVRPQKDDSEPEEQQPFNRVRDYYDGLNRAPEKLENQEQDQ